MRRWLELLRPAAAPGGGRCVVFPHAGSAPGPYRALAERLPAEVEVVAVALPGRGRRAGERVPSDPATVVREVNAELGALAAARTQVFYGHSMGASLALACATAARRPGCDALVVSAGLPGGALEARSGGSGIEQAAGELFAQSAAGDSEAALLAADLPLARAAVRETARARLDSPVVALAGTEDALAPAALARQWHRHTTADFRLEVVEGHHFFPFSGRGRQRVAAAIGRLFTECTECTDGLPLPVPALPA